ncbi:hypothetical protein H5833_17120 [Klebsiella pneumoniae]|uniref:hypothetical protein n=1 Tax=Klebsiella pneumoniae TaxID=573 RepID=UPI000CECD207|nr:hypothetical protein [Klebsiella pneumoniae]AVO94084.1 hypothetical protein AM475_04220 [Klebsiella pneumoniae subsp. ozaenae]AXZ19995.1 hypothetical protein AM476_18490 [Klebsiella pneumoniae]EIX9640692.1 hypothetical protein [Klebsiella pneumoniae]MCB3449607.1 hypothetical protein [Klebsiella pneumoniae]MCR1256036.1 hypothetical protein [Klebsiella pneumoniae]
MNISTVNELIASLESAGELSIREQKFLKLAKAYQQLAAENVALKSAVDHTIEWIESTNGDPCDVVILKGIRTPATDRIVAEIKADEEKVVLNDLLRHLDKIDIENLSSPWELSSEVVAFVNSRLLRDGADK